MVDMHRETIERLTRQLHGSQELVHSLSNESGILQLKAMNAEAERDALRAENAQLRHDNALLSMAARAAAPGEDRPNLIDCYRAEVERLKAEWERKDAAWREQAAQDHAATLTALDRAESAERKLAMAGEALEKAQTHIKAKARDFDIEVEIGLALAAIDAKDGE